MSKQLSPAVLACLAQGPLPVQSSVKPVEAIRTTVKLDLMRSVVIEPDAKGVRIAMTVGAIEVGSFVLGADQVGVVLFAIEKAAGAAGIEQDRPA